MRNLLATQQIIENSETIPIVLNGKVGKFPSNDETCKRPIYGLLVTANGGLTENGVQIATPEQAKSMMILIESEKRRIDLPLSYFMQNNGKFGRLIINGYNTSQSKIYSHTDMGEAAILLTFIYVKE